MNDSHKNQAILAAIERVEHPAISTTLVDLGIIRNVEVAPDGRVTLTLVLSFQNIPDNIRDYMVNSLAAAAQSAGGELTEVKLTVMNEADLQNFLVKEQQHWLNSDRFPYATRLVRPATARRITDSQCNVAKRSRRLWQTPDRQCDGRGVAAARRQRSLHVFTVSRSQLYCCGAEKYRPTGFGRVPGEGSFHRTGCHAG
jgi:metal-sulfur cluster biosynthetic enzyme